MQESTFEKETNPAFINCRIPIISETMHEIIRMTDNPEMTLSAVPFAPEKIIIINNMIETDETDNIAIESGEIGSLFLLLELLFAMASIICFPACCILICSKLDYLFIPDLRNLTHFDFSKEQCRKYHISKISAKSI